jgi:mono/diheme cytochrome c family protein
MIGWGAPVPPESVAPIVELLTAEHGVGASPPPPAEMAVSSAEAELKPEPAPLGGDAKRGAAVYAAACASCHGANGGGGPVGTALVERPSLWRARDFEEVVRGGRRRMPAVPLAGAAVSDLLAFLRAPR